MHRVTHVTGEEDALTRSERRRLCSVLKSFIEKVARSPLGQVELDAEPAIRDFIVDLMLMRAGLAVSMQAVLEVAAFEESSELERAVTPSDAAKRARHAEADAPSAPSARLGGAGTSRGGRQAD